MGLDAPITRGEHEEFRRAMTAENARLAAEDARQNKRLEVLEDTVREIGVLTTSVAKLASSMESMLKEQEKQGERLEALEGRDGEKWRQVTGYIITAVVGLIVGFIFRQIGM